MKIRKRRKSLGFTLVETMIALTIVAIALPAMVSVVSAQLSGAGMMRERTYAYWIAQNELTRLQLLQQQKLNKQLPNFKFPEKESGTREMLGIRWNWYMETEAVEGLPVQGFKRVTVYVNMAGLVGSSNNTSTQASRKPTSSMAMISGFVSDPDVTL